MSLPERGICTFCGGTGDKEIAPGDVRYCPECDGEGSVTLPERGDAITTAARWIRRCRPEPMYRGDLPGVVNAADRRVAEAVLDAVRPLIQRERDAELRRRIGELRGRDCPYLGNYKLGYDTALGDLLALLGEPTKESE